MSEAKSGAVEQPLQRWWVPVDIEDIHQTRDGLYFVLIGGVWLQLGFSPPVEAYASDDELVIYCEDDYAPVLEGEVGEVSEEAQQGLCPSGKEPTVE